MRHLTEQEFLAPLRAGDIELNRETRRITRSGRIVHVSPLEFRLLECLMETPGRILSRAQLLETVWEPTTIDRRIVDTQISQLRKALIQDDETNPVKTVHGSGYRLINSFDNP
jgi:two-component system phosphate regulon response regulator PhoB